MLKKMNLLFLIKNVTMNIAPSVKIDTLNVSISGDLLYADGYLFASDGFEVVVIENGTKKTLCEMTSYICRLEYHCGFLFCLDYNSVLCQIDIKNNDVYDYPVNFASLPSLAFSGDFVFFEVDEHKIAKWNYAEKREIEVFEWHNEIKKMIIAGDYIFIQFCGGDTYKQKISESTEIYLGNYDKIFALGNSAILLFSNRENGGMIEIVDVNSAANVKYCKCNIEKLTDVIFAGDSIYMLGKRYTGELICKYNFADLTLKYEINIEPATTLAYYRGFLFTLHTSRQICQWNAESGKLIHTFKGYNDVINRLNFSGDYLIAMNTENKICRIHLDPYHSAKLTLPHFSRREKTRTAALAAILFGAGLNKNFAADILAAISQN